MIRLCDNFNTVGHNELPIKLKKGDLVFYKNSILYFNKYEENGELLNFTDPIKGQTKLSIDKIMMYGKY